MCENGQGSSVCSALVRIRFDCWLNGVEVRRVFSYAVSDMMPRANIGLYFLHICRNTHTLGCLDPKSSRALGQANPASYVGVPSL